MEQLVRPFQLPDPFAKARVAAVSQPVAQRPAAGQVAAVNQPITSLSGAPPAHLCWGSAGNLPTAVRQKPNFNGSSFRVEECDEHLGEESKDTEDLVVQADNDPSKFVVVRRIRKITFTKAKKDKFLGVFHTDTTDFGLIDPFAGSGFGDVAQHHKCGQTMYLNR